MTLRPASASQFAASERGELPSPDAVRDGVWSVPLPLPPTGGPPYSLAYLIVDAGDAVHIVDPGSQLDENWERLEAALAGIGRRMADVASVTVTHLHHDHLGLAGRVRSASGARVGMLAAEQLALDRRSTGDQPPDFAGWGVPDERRPELEAVLRDRRHEPFAADVLLAAGDRLDIPGREVQVIATPGHTIGHLCLRDPHDRLLFTGDHLLPRIFPGIGLAGESANPFGDYLESLARIAVFDDHEVCPGHGYRFLGVAERCEQTRAHQARRTEEVARIVRDHPGASVWEVASRVSWTDGWDGLRPRHVLSALAQTQQRMAFLAA